MSSSTQAKWTKPSKALLCLVFLGVGPVMADPDTPPRTPQESARIAAAMRLLPGQPNPFESNPGGKGTLHGAAPDRVFSAPLTGIEPEARMNFVLGQAMFEKFWVQSPSSTKASDGLGPYYNARSCSMCHPGNGRGAAPDGDAPLPMTLMLRLSVQGGDTHGIQEYLATLPDPHLGGQLQTDAISGLDPEGAPTVRYQHIKVELPGETVTLRRPLYDAGAPLSAQTMISPRLAPPLHGMGLIDAIRDADILANADPQDRDGDGISGRANWGLSRDTGQVSLGRYGWKAGNATLREQVADAFSNDIGISSPIFEAGWGDCTPTQTACRAAPHGDGDVRGTELDQQGLDLTTLYVGHLAVPARPAAHSALPGRDLFVDLGCAACHRPAYVTERRENDPLRGFQMIWPYSDFLLHDMGEGLADHRPEHRATGREWRTPPLWGIGRTKQVLDSEYYLHDGRARTLTEAILWHAGEAQPARDRFSLLAPPDRDALIKFLESL